MKNDILPTALISRLIPRYAEPHRRYHTWSHIAAVFDASEQISEDRSQQLALAIFFHDAIYEPLKKDNEERSADLCRSECQREGIDEGIAKEACALILATRHAEDHALVGPAFERTRVLVDSDLSILGMEKDIFQKYEEAIRAEYSVATDMQFAAGRAAVMKSFLDREDIFQTARGQALWEDKARENVLRSYRFWYAKVHYH